MENEEYPNSNTMTVRYLKVKDKDHSRRAIGTCTPLLIILIIKINVINIQTYVYMLFAWTSLIAFKDVKDLRISANKLNSA